MEINYPEGATPLDQNELDGLKFKHVTTRRELDHLEQANIESGLMWLKKNKSSDILNEVFIRKLHRKLFGDVWCWAGQFRKTDKNIGVDARTLSVELKNLLDDTAFWIENTVYSPVETAIRFHHRLVYIHLFPNGNGRHARIMADTLLTKIFNTQRINWSGNGAITMDQRRTEYIKALQAADSGDYKPLFAFVGITGI